jgi:hypothetical protein
MNLPPLSREALQVLELLPAWQLRGAKSTQPSNVAVAAAESEPVGRAALTRSPDQTDAAIEEVMPKGQATIGRAQGAALMIVVPRWDNPASPPARLWTQIARALHGLGLPKNCLDQPLQLAPTEQQLLAAELNAHDPQWVLVFGDDLAQMAALVDPMLMVSATPALPATTTPTTSARRRLFKTFSLDEMASEPLKKAQAWQDFCGLKPLL